MYIDDQAYPTGVYNVENQFILHQFILYGSDLKFPSESFSTCHPLLSVFSFPVLLTFAVELHFELVCH